MIVLPGDDWRPRLIADAEATIQRLNALLGVSRPVADRYLGVPIRRFVSELLAAVEHGKREAAEINLLLLGKLTEDLDRVRHTAPKLFAHYKRRLETSNESTYRGLRFEIGTASAFASQGVPFSWPRRTATASPDFLVASPDGTCSIECVVCQVRTTTTEDLTYKLSAAINKKTRKSYSSPDLVLFIDTTDLVYARMEEGHVWNDVNLRETVASLLRGAAVGSAVLIGYVFEQYLVSGRRYSRVYLRSDNATVGRHASWFLERYYPQGGDKELKDYAVPFTP